MRIALLGNPNSGKTTLFNVITGSRARVGNFPGVTVEKRIGNYKGIEIVDLPGLYSLTPYSPDERVARNYLIEEKPDVVIHVVDATNLERNLYLTTQLMELDLPVVVALNMSDVVIKEGKKINVELLSKNLGLPVVEVSALRKKGIKELMQAVESGKAKPTEMELDFGDDKEGEFAFTSENLSKAQEIAEARYLFIEKATAKVIEEKATTPKKSFITTSDRIDKVMTNRIFGIPLFLLVMFGVFHLTFSENLFYLAALIPEGTFDIPFLGTDAFNSPGVVLVGFMEAFSGWVTELFQAFMPEGTWYTALVIDGILSGLLAVLSFVPQILTLFFFIGILEDSGYMARVAFLLDRAFRRFGLSGKAFLPLLSCFGCAIPGIAGTRMLQDPKERIRTIYLTPFISCGAKLPIWSAFAGVFASAYGINAEGLVFGIYLFGILMAVVGALFLKKTFIKGEMPPFVMEMPSYRLPMFRNLMIRVWEKLKQYLFRATTIIVAAIIVIWFISNFGFNFQRVDDVEISIVGYIARGLQWLFVPLGFGMGVDGWKFVVAAITGLIAKEMVVATLGTFSGMSNGEAAFDIEGSAMATTAETMPLATLMIGIGGGALGGISIAIPAMLSYLVFNLMSVPCMAAVATAKAELGSAKKTWGAIAFWLGASYITSMIIFWLGVLLSWIFGA